MSLHQTKDRDYLGVYQEVTRLISSIQAVTVIEQRRDGSLEKWFERHLAPIIDNEGNIDCVIEAVRDITDQILLKEEQMQRMKLEGVIEMAGTAAHQLNTPLFAALCTAQLLREDLPSAEMTEEIDTIIRNMKKMAELTREMTTATGFESKEYVGDTRIVELKSSGDPFSKPDQTKQVTH